MSDFDEHRVRVRYAETDQMGVAYYANYFVWFEVGRSEFCRRRGFSYDEMEKLTNCFLVVAEATCRYRAPLRYDMEFVLRTSLRELRRRSMTFSYELADPAGETIFAIGETKHVVVGADGRPRTFPEVYYRLLQSRGD